MEWIPLEKKPKIPFSLFDTRFVADTDDVEFRGDNDAAFWLYVEQHGKRYKSKERWTSARLNELASMLV
jgi:hypothetical protein